MPLPKIEDARKLSDEELADEILAAKRELFQLRMQKATRRLEKTHQFKQLRHKIGQMMTVLGERKLIATKAPQESPKIDAQAPQEQDKSVDAEESEQSQSDTQQEE